MDSRLLLQRADSELLTAARVSRYLLYHRTRTLVAELAPVDSFYIGFRQGESAIAYPYNWDGHEYDDPNVNTFSPEGLTAWIVKHKKTYWSKSDQALLLHRGRAFGDTQRRSAEAIVAPLLENKQVIGVLAVLSYTTPVYDAATVRFVEGLAEILVTALSREREDQERRARWGLAEPTEPPITETLRRLRRQAERLRELLADHPALEEAERLCQTCAQAQTESAEWLLQGQETDPLAGLTPREREIAQLLTLPLTYCELGERLGISEKTVKTHCANLLRKLGIGGRSGVAQLLAKNTPKV